MKPQSAKATRNLHGKYLRPLNKYRQAKTPLDYFNQRVIKHAGYYDTDCWQFNTQGDKNGYPMVTNTICNRELSITRAHQLAYKLFNGDIPNGMLVCHSCDNPWCVNPKHLFIGTPNDNVQDMMRKGRYIHPTQKGYNETC